MCWGLFIHDAHELSQIGNAVRVIIITALRTLVVLTITMVLGVYVMAWAMQKNFDPGMLNDLVFITVLYAVAGSITYAIVKHRRT